MAKESGASLNVAKKDPFRRFELKVSGLGGLNTALASNEITDNECQSLWNYLPIGKNIWRKIASPTKYATPAVGTNIVFFYADVLGGTLYEFVILADGSAGLITNGVYAQLAGAGAGTFSATAYHDASTWENQVFCIVDSVKGYFIVTGATAQSITLSSQTINFAANTCYSFSNGISTSTLGAAGAGYKAGDIFTVNGGTIQAAGSVLTAAGISGTPAINAGGAQYSVGDLFTINGGTILAQGHVTAVTAGAATAIVIDSIGSGYATGIAGTAAKTGLGYGLSLNIAAVTGVLTYTISMTGAGYAVANGVATTAKTGTGTGLTINITALIGPLTATAIAIWQGRVLLGTNRNVAYSAALDYTFFGVGSGAFAITSPNLKTQIQKIIGYQDSVFLIGDHGIIALTGTTISSDPTTWYQMEIFNSLGSTSGPSVFNYQNQLFLQNEFGIYRVASTQSEKVDVILDITQIINLQYLSTVAQVNNLNFYLLPVQVFSPFSQTQRNAILAYCVEINKFSLLDMGWDCNGIFGARSLTDHSIYAWSGDSVYRLFQGGGAINSLFRGKSFDFEASNTVKAIRYVQVNYAAKTGQPVFQVSVNATQWAGTVVTTTGTNPNPPSGLTAQITPGDYTIDDVTVDEGSVSGVSSTAQVQNNIFQFTGAGGVLFDLSVQENTAAIFDIVEIMTLGNFGRTYR